LKNPTADARKEQERIEEAIKAVTAAGGDNAETLRLLRNRQIDLRAQSQKTFGAGAIKGIKDYYESISDNAKNAADFVGSAFNSLEDDLSEFFQSGKLDFDNFKNAIIKGLADIAAKAVISTGINFLGEVFPNIGFADGGAVEGFASGGAVSGPGGPRDDSILARLSDGEFVMSASAVNKFGKDFFSALNTGQVPGRTSVDEGVFSGVPQFGLGGFFDKAADFVTDGLKSAGDVVESARDSIIEEGGELFGGVIDSAKSLISGVLDGDITAIASAALPFILPGVGSGISAALGQFGAAGFGGTVANVGSAISNSFASGVFGAGSTTAIAKSVATKLAADTFTDTLSDKLSEKLVGGFSSLTGATASPFLEKRAMGGPLSSGQASIVGENGPEVFIPNRNGTVSAVKGSGGDLIGAVNEVRDEISDLRRQFSRALAGQALVGAR
jgi:hypothetical protein